MDKERMNDSMGDVLSPRNRNRQSSVKCFCHFTQASRAISDANGRRILWLGNDLHIFGGKGCDDDGEVVGKRQ